MVSAAEREEIWSEGEGLEVLLWTAYPHEGTARYKSLPFEIVTTGPYLFDSIIILRLDRAALDAQGLE